MAKDLPVEVKSRKTGEKDYLRTNQVNVGNDLNKRMEGYFNNIPLEDVDASARDEAASRKVDKHPGLSHSLNSAAKVSAMKRRGKARK